jgi:DNA-binding NarL/FixJ family response regulator
MSKPTTRILLCDDHFVVRSGLAASLSLEQDLEIIAEASDAVEAVAGALAAGAPLALRGMKQSLDEIARGDFHLSTLREREARCAASDDLREGRLAMAEKRPPRFTGR